MRSQNYQNPTQSTSSAFAYATGSEFWNHLHKTPIQSQLFNEFMATRREGRPNWYDLYPIDRELSPSSPEIDPILRGESDILLVDVGGNRGHDLVNLKAKHPNLVGKMILQDLPDVIAHASFSPEDEIEAMPHDFFQPQPIQRISLLSFWFLVEKLTDQCDRHEKQQTPAPTTSAPSSMTGPMHPAATSSLTPPRP